MRRVWARLRALGRPWASHRRSSPLAGPQTGTSRSRPRAASSWAPTPSSPARASRSRSWERKAREVRVSGGRPGQSSGRIREARAASSSAPASSTGAGRGAGRCVREVVRTLRARAAGVRTRTVPPSTPRARRRWAARPRRTLARTRVGVSRTASLPSSTARTSRRRARLVFPVPGAPRTTRFPPARTCSRTTAWESSGSGRPGTGRAGRSRGACGAASGVMCPWNHGAPTPPRRAPRPPAPGRGRQGRHRAGADRGRTIADPT